MGFACPRTIPQRESRSSPPVACPGGMESSRDGSSLRPPSWDVCVYATGPLDPCVHCTPDYAYGDGGFPAWGIQPNSSLKFEIEVLKIE